MNDVQTLAKEYCALVGLAEPTIGHYVQNDVEQAKEIATAYEALPSYDTSIATLNAYTALKAEIELQYDYAVLHGFTFENWTQEGQPYANSKELCEDVLNNKHMWVFTGGDVHPLLGETNNKFRAVHDLFGHCAEGFQFGPRGEHNAWLHHSMMFSSTAQRALTTETRGQNSWVNYGPYSNLPVTERPFAEQKVALLPDVYCNWYRFL